MPIPSTSNFIDKAKTVHNGLYTYEKTIIVKRREPVIITCKVHGDFKQLAGNHLKGMGCPICGRERTSQASAAKAQRAGEKFVTDALTKHGNKYDYSKVIYKNCKTNVTIICPAHGEFEQTPSNHLNKNNTCGCPKCGKESSVLAALRDKEMHTERLKQLAAKSMKAAEAKFMKTIKEVHGGFYDYSLVEYKGRKSLITIICPVHGEFKQGAATHLKGSGCTKCNRSLGERNIVAWLEEHNIEFREQVTIPEYSIAKRFDFYIPSIDTYIEYDGRQHFEPISRFGGAKKLAEQQEYDAKTNWWCKMKGINLIRISYLENIQKRLSDILLEGY